MNRQEFLKNGLLSAVGLSATPVFAEKAACFSGKNTPSVSGVKITNVRTFGIYANGQTHIGGGGKGILNGNTEGADWLGKNGKNQIKKCIAVRGVASKPIKYVRLKNVTL